MGITWAPIRITFESTEGKMETDLYLVSEFNGAFSENQNLFEELKLWLSRNVLGKVFSLKNRPFAKFTHKISSQFYASQLQISTGFFKNRNRKRY